MRHRPALGEGYVPSVGQGTQPHEPVSRDSSAPDGVHGANTRSDPDQDARHRRPPSGAPKRSVRPVHRAALRLPCATDEDSPGARSGIHLARTFGPRGCLNRIPSPIPHSRFRTSLSLPGKLTICHSLMIRSRNFPRRRTRRASSVQKDSPPWIAGTLTQKM